LVGAAHAGPETPPTRPSATLTPKAWTTRFVAIHDFSTFDRKPGPEGTQELRSKIIDPGFAWQELIVSWNLDPRRVEAIRVAARVHTAGQVSGFYHLGQWATDTNRHARWSVPGQKDPLAEVQTDTLVLRESGQGAELHLRLVATPGQGPVDPKFIGLSFAGGKPPAGPTPRSPLRNQHKPLEVPARSQLLYPGGEVWCSPTATSMVLAYWAKQLERGELDRTVPEVARAVYDPHWPGTGNWPFNMAYAGSFDGLRAYVHRLHDLAEVEAWIGVGVPVVLSVSYNRLKGKPTGGSGHLVVCTGFSPQGDVLVNDPGVREGVRRVFPRTVVDEAWAESRNTVYLIYPTHWKTPPERSP
jgi:hypothetical protein